MAKGYKKYYMKFNMKKINKFKPFLIIFFVGVILFAILIKFGFRYQGSDDTVFQQLISPYPTVFDWVIHRYETWSGRIFAESFIYLFSSAPLYLWKIVSVILYSIFSVMIFLYYKLFSNQEDVKKDILMLSFCFCIPFFTYVNTLSSGVLWVTGSMNYFWIVTFGLVGFYPIAYYLIYKKLAPTLYIIISTFSLIIAACSQEQVGATLLGLSILFLIYSLYLYKKREQAFPTYLIISTTIIIIAFSFGILAPGNKIRLIAETKYWLPDFYTIPLLAHIEYSYRWFLNATINNSGFLLILSWGLLALLFIKKRTQTNFQRIIIITLTILCFATLAKSYEPIKWIFEFYPTWKPIVPNRISYIALALGLFTLIITIIAPLILFKKNKKGWIISILFLTAFANIAIIVVSPTVYASGSRTLFVPSIILTLINIFLINEVMVEYKKYQYIIASLIFTTASLSYLYLLLALIHHQSPIL